MTNENKITDKIIKGKIEKLLYEIPVMKEKKNYANRILELYQELKNNSLTGIDYSQDYVDSSPSPDAISNMVIVNDIKTEKIKNYIKSIDEVIDITNFIIHSVEEDAIELFEDRFVNGYSIDKITDKLNIGSSTYYRKYRKNINILINLYKNDKQLFEYTMNWRNRVKVLFLQIQDFEDNNISQ